MSRFDAVLAIHTGGGRKSSFAGPRFTAPSAAGDRS